MDLGILLKSGADQSTFLAKPIQTSTPAAAGDGLLAGRSEEVARQEREAEEALLQYCSFPEVRRLPNQAAIEAQSRAWLTALYQGRLPAARVERLLDTRLDTLGCVFYPHGSSDARSLTLNKLIHWFFVLDDVLDDPHLMGHDYDAAVRFSRRHFQAMFGGDMSAMKVVGLASDEDEDTAPDANPDVAEPKKAAGMTDDQEAHYATSLAKAQQELVIEVGVQWAEEMRALGMSHRQLERLREAVAEYLAGIVGIVKLRQEKRLPELEEYIKLRRMDGADKLALLGCEFDLGIELDDPTLQHPLMQELHATTADQLLWLNDLLSFNREYHNDDYVSLLAVLHYNNARTSSTSATDGSAAAAAGAADGKKAPVELADFQEALCEARAMLKKVDQERVRVASQIAAWRPDLIPYVEATHFTISGITFWTLWSQRYQRRGPI